MRKKLTPSPKIEQNSVDRKIVIYFNHNICLYFKIEQNIVQAKFGLGLIYN